MIHFACPNCGKSFRVKDEHAGRQAPCSNCRQEMQVPAREPEILHSETPDPFDASPPLPEITRLENRRESTSKGKKNIKQVKRSGSRAGVWVALAVGGGVLILATVLATAGLTLWATGFFLRSSSAPEISSAPEPEIVQQPQQLLKADVANNAALQAAPAPQAKPKPGKVRVIVTWKFNDVVGNKPDTDSVVVLIPKTLKEKIPDTAGLVPRFARISFDRTKKSLEERDVYAGIVGGDGRTLLSGVPPGSYTLIIFSRNTNDHPNVREPVKQRLEEYFMDAKQISILSKTHFSDIEVIEGEEIEISHDFGNTYI